MSRQNKNNQQDQSRNQRHWRAHVAAQKQSGLSRIEYCKQHKLSYHALGYWHRKLSKPQSSETNLVPVTLVRSLKQNPVQSEGSALKVILPDNIAIEVSDNFSPVTLARLLATLESR